MPSTRVSFFRKAVVGRSYLTLTCPGCGCVYRTAIDPPAKAATGKDGSAALRVPPGEPAELRPCPICGLVSPPAVAASTKTEHLSVWAWSGLGAAAVGGLATAGLLPFFAATVLIPTFGLAGLLLHMRIAAGNPNRRRREKNLRRGQEHVRARRHAPRRSGRVASDC